MMLVAENIVMYPKYVMNLPKLLNLNRLFLKLNQDIPVCSFKYLHYDVYDAECFLS